MHRASLSILTLISSINILFLAAPAPAQESGAEPVSFRRRIVEDVRLEGIRAFSESDIKKLLYTRPNRWYNVFKKRELSRSDINLDEALIKRFYQRRGYLFTEVSSEIERVSDNKAMVTFRIDEGRLTYLDSIGLNGGLDEINRRFNRILNDFDKGRPVDLEKVNSGGFRLRDLYYNNGYPYARIYSRQAFNFDSTWVEITYVVEESVFAVNDQTVIVDNTYTRPFVIKREIVAKPKKRYSQKDVVDSEQRLYSLGMFRLVNLRRNDTTAVIINDTCHVGFNLSLRERQSYFVNFGFGLGRDEEFPLVLRSSALWGNRNLFGTGRKLIAAVRPQFQIANAKGDLAAFNLSDLGRDLRLSFVRSTFELNYITPWTFRWRVPLTARVFYEPYTLQRAKREDELSYRYDRIAGEVFFTREIDRFTLARVTANTEYVNIRAIPPEQEDAFRRERGDNPIRRRVMLHGERDTRDNIFVPQKGSFSFVGVDFVGGPLGGDFSYIRSQFMWSRFNRFAGQNILASRIWLGYIDDRFEGGNSSPDDRYTIGGANTIRGYRLNSVGPQPPKPVGGRYMLLGNIEIRRPLFWRFGGTAFFDAGNSYARVEEITPISVRFGTGLGVQFFTPIGPIRLEYAVRLQKEFDLGAGLYHLSILYAF
jgi:outer membrane protein insertion porin family